MLPVGFPGRGRLGLRGGTIRGKQGCPRPLALELCQPPGPAPVRCPLSSLSTAAAPYFPRHPKDPPNADSPVGRPAQQSTASPWLGCRRLRSQAAHVEPSLHTPAPWGRGDFWTPVFRSLSFAGTGCLERSNTSPSTLWTGQRLSGFGLDNLHPENSPTEPGPRWEPSPRLSGDTAVITRPCPTSSRLHVAPQHLLSGGPPPGPLKWLAAESTVQAEPTAHSQLPSKVRFLFYAYVFKPRRLLVPGRTGSLCDLGKVPCSPERSGLYDSQRGFWTPSYRSALLLVRALRCQCPLLWRAVARAWSVLKEGSPAL